MEPLAVRPVEAAKALGISRSRLYESLDSREIDSVKLGAARLIPVDSLRSFVERHRSAAIREPVDAA